MLHITLLIKALLRRKLSVFLISTQIAIATAIFSNLAYIVQDVKGDINRPTGFDEDQLFTVTFRPINASNYANTQFDLQTIHQLPGVEHASYMRRNPIFSGGGSGKAAFRTHPDTQSSSINVYKIDVSEHALATLDLKLIEGRNFTAEDMSIEPERNGDGPSTIIISETLAKSLFGENKNYIGQMIYEGNIAREVIGVSEDSLGFTRPSDGSAEKTAFYPHFIESETEFRYLVRSETAEQRAQLIEEVSTLIRKNYQNQLFLYIEKIDDLKEISDRNQRIYIYQILVLIIILGLIVAFAISGQTLFNVNQRRKQTGIRRALGASRYAIIKEIVYENILICCLGLSVGIIFSIITNQFMMQQITRLPGIPPIFVIATCLLLLAICILSAAFPAWQAGKVSPSVATRTV